MSTAHIMVGMVGSGKSTLLKTLEGVHILSSDALREELYGDINDQTHNDEVFKELYKRANELLAEGHDVGIDATNISSKGRVGIIDILKKNATRFEAHYLCTPYEKSKLWNSRRERKVPEDVIKRMYKSLEVPVYREGWDDIHIHMHFSNGDQDLLSTRYNRAELEEAITSNTSYTQLMGLILFQSKVFQDIYNFSQDSPWHSLSVSRHIYYVWKFILENYKGSESKKLKLLWTALFHDVGKPFCKTYKRLEDGNENRYANFYNHEFVSAQLACAILTQLGYSQGFILDVVDMVQNHMRLLSIGDSEKGKNKLIALVGQEMFDDLTFFREADSQAK